MGKQFNRVIGMELRDAFATRCLSAHGTDVPSDAWAQPGKYRGST
jgi:hypothetical protein